MTQTSQLSVECESGRVILRSPNLGRAAPWETVRAIVSRLLAAKCVESIILDRFRETATIRLKNDPVDRTSAANEQLHEIACCLRTSASAGHQIHDAYHSCRRTDFKRTEFGIVTASIAHSLPGRMRLRHPLVRRNPEMASRVESSLSRIPGIHSVSTSMATGSVVVLYDPTTELAKRLPAAVERAVGPPDDSMDPPSGPSLNRWVASGTCLALATASTFAVPALAPVTAVALVGWNLPTMVRGMTELCTFRWRIASLYTVIMGATLVSGQFLAAALMQACITGWHGWSSYRLRKVIFQLRRNAEPMFTVDDLLQIPATNRQRRIEDQTERLLTVNAGGILPCDGVIIEGEGDLNERCVRGIDRMTHRTKGESVFAGSTLVNGHLRIQSTAVGRNTRLSKVHQTLLNAIKELPGAGGPTERSQTAGSRFVPFTFAAGTAALAVGDVSTLVAVLRPDFTTGPSISERFGTLSRISQLLNRGWLVKDSETLNSLARTDALVTIQVDGAPSLRGAGANHRPSEMARLKRHRLNLFSRKIDFHEIEGDEDSCLEYVRRLHTSQRRIAVIGCGSVLRKLINDDVLLVSLTPEDFFEEQTADMVALHSDPQNVKELIRVLHESSRPAEQAWAAILACNALAISGAFVIGLTSLHVVVLTNLGALAAGALYSRQIRAAGQILSSRVQTEQHLGAIV